MVEKLCVSTAGGMGFIPGWGTKILRAVQCGQKIGKKKKRIITFETVLLAFGGVIEKAKCLD